MGFFNYQWRAPWALALQLAILPLSGGAQENRLDCIANTLHAQIENLAEKHYDDKNIYECGLCFLNSGELGRLILEKLGPQVKPSDLKLLVIKHRDGRYDRQDVAKNIDQALIGHKKFGRGQTLPPVWHYHAVLEHQGSILDLDHVNGWKRMSFDTFLEQMLPSVKSPLDRIEGQPDWVYVGFDFRRAHNRLEELRITEVPLEEYLSRYPKGRPARWQFSRDFIERFPSMTFEQFRQKQSSRLSTNHPPQ
jgi:hypothetical protein